MQLSEGGGGGWRKEVEVSTGTCCSCPSDWQKVPSGHTEQKCSSEEAPPPPTTSGNNGINFLPKRESDGSICLADKGLFSTANICRLHKLQRSRWSKRLRCGASAAVWNSSRMFFLENILCGALKRIVWRICFRRSSVRYKRWGWTGPRYIFRFNLYLELCHLNGLFSFTPLIKLCLVSQTNLSGFFCFMSMSFLNER